MKANDQAFPRAVHDVLDSINDSYYPPTGLTVRDYIAIKAMQGLLITNEYLIKEAGLLAENSYKFADAMIAESEKE